MTSTNYDEEIDWDLDIEEEIKIAQDELDARFLESIREEKEQRTCPTCKLVYTNLGIGLFLRHKDACRRKLLKASVNASSFTCNLCDKILNNKYNYDKHYEKCKKIHAEEEENGGPVNLTCDLCNRTMNNKFNFDSHYEKCKLATEKRNSKVNPTCDICSKVCQSDYHLEQHKKVCQIRNEKPETTFKCDICNDNKFKTEYHLNVHKKACQKRANQNKETYKCDVCLRTDFQSEYHLSQHTKAKKCYSATN